MEELPTAYDVIVIGTGMTGSITAAAFSRIGKSVLHIDENEYYGENWASFNLDTLNSWIAQNESLVQNDPINTANFLKSEETFIPVSRNSACRNINQKWNCPKENPKESGEQEENVIDEKEEKKEDRNEVWTEEKLKAEYRKFNLDLSPKMLYSRGPLVELLISSNIARYAEFKSVSRVLTWRENRLEVVPSSRADVFATKHVTVVQKRMLVKVLTIFADYPATKDEFIGYEEKTLVEYLKHKKLPDQLIHYIVYAIAMGTNKMSCMQGVLACQRFLLSLGRYGNTPFIFPMYGAGELPQCFCRLCAVFGGVYHLNRKVDGYILSPEGNVLAIISGGQRLEAKQFVISSSVCPPKFVMDDNSVKITRGIFITDRSIATSVKEAVTLLQFPPDDDHDYSVTVMEVGGSCHICPEGLFAVHMTTEGDSINHVEKLLFDKGNYQEGEETPNVLWSLTWSHVRGCDLPSSDCPPNLKIFCGPDPGLDYDVEVQKAKEIFLELSPDCEFLPRAPDPEEIILGDPEPQNVAENESDDKTLVQSVSEIENDSGDKIEDDVEPEEKSEVK